ncbi:metallophosphoesterase [Ramlibacter solisilvae]|uniref:metallophosphoesterase family protein n=1 Tax=Ramlibacter tataouinensis TaxID=94132 RepID=UPI000777F5E2|nr:metallophosphoesterase [Ramlibacter tataouinensis]
MRIALIADSHLSPRAPECVHNWRAAGSAAAARGAQLTVHLGDISFDGEHMPTELDYAAGLVRDWPTPMRCVPGNHDIGTGSGEQPLPAHLLPHYRRAFGADRWTMQHGNWVLIGLNAQLLGTATRDEAEQWDWLEDIAAGLAANDRAILFLHRPLVRAPGDRGMPTGRYVDAAPAHSLRAGPLRHALALVVSGHTHQALDFTADGLRHLWVPSSAFVIPDAMQPAVGEKEVGIGLLVLHGDQLAYERVQAPLMRRHELPGLACYRTLPRKH